ncbi:2-haloacid dehalogenase [Raineyella antarctica]|uniref:2-haloacid dehalogenase n=1 Tax=Raineyella antarctica TaxID=1577474 RepID=A0A1G6HBW0_9ACTN|nr:haloacid dehalogenase type II [Raineyella antarctica]SDB91787.1 2-haloacid dehalogenase [Raineyella antarctica]
MAPDTSVIVFDVNETLSDMSLMADRFEEVCAPGYLARLWFATVLREGFALAAAGASARFADIGTEVLRTVLSGADLDRGLDAAVSYVMAGMKELKLHPDVAPGMRLLKEHGYRLVTLSNGSTDVAEQLLGPAGLRDEVDLVLSVEDAGVWKPAQAAYEYAAEACGVRPEQMMMVAVHPWDLHGAAGAGLRTGWINRTHARYPEYFRAPDATAATLVALAGEIGPGPGAAA